MLKLKPDEIWVLSHSRSNFLTSPCLFQVLYYSFFETKTFDYVVMFLGLLQIVISYFNNMFVLFRNVTIYKEHIEGGGGQGGGVWGVI